MLLHWLNVTSWIGSTLLNYNYANCPNMLSDLVSCRMDHILLETTGLADPAPLVSVLWLDDQLESSIVLDSIITVS